MKYCNSLSQSFRLFKFFLVSNRQLQETFELTKVRRDMVSTVRDKSLNYSILHVLKEKFTSLVNGVLLF